MNEFVTNLLTKADNSTYDEGKVAGFLIIMTSNFCLLVSALIVFWKAVVMSEAADEFAFLQGVAAVLTADGIVLGLMLGGMGARDKLTPK